MDHRAGRGGDRVHRVHRRVAQEPAYQDIHRVVQGGGEQHPLAVRRGGRQQPPHHRQEAEISHVVRLVQHADLHIAQVTVPLLDEVGQPPGTGHHDVHPVMQRRHLGILPGTAENGGHCQVHRLGQRHQHGLNLAGQFPGGHQDQATGRPALVNPLASPATSGIEKAEGLTGTGPAAAQDVPPSQRIRQRSRLDRERHRDPVSGQRADQWPGNARGRRSSHAAWSPRPWCERDRFPVPGPAAPARTAPG